MTTLNVTALQMSATPGDVEGNVAAVVASIREHGGESDLVVTPELVTSGYDLDLLATSAVDLAQPLDGPAVAAMVGAAAETAATVVLGLLERDGDTVFDSAVTISPDGSVATYRKTHLYPTESELFGVGADLTTVDMPAARLGPMICFEHAFPEIATSLALAGSEVLVIPSAVGDGFDHLLTLRSRARAQDNQVFVVACNQCGNGFCGYSLIADPRGDVVAAAGPEPAVLTATLDLALISAERDREPTLVMRRPELYGLAFGE